MTLLEASGPTPLLDYFRRPVLVTLAEKPIFITNMMDKVDFTANCSGGGLSGQAGALSMSLARALQKMDPGLRALLGAGRGAGGRSTGRALGGSIRGSRRCRD